MVEASVARLMLAADELNPFAVEARYGLAEPGRVDREPTTLMVGAVLAWAEGQLSNPSAQGKGQ